VPIRHALLLLLPFCASAPAALAQTATAQAAPAVAPPPVPWWLIPARAENPRSEKWLFHVEAAGVITKTTGNLGGYTIGATTTFFTRKDLFTNVVQVKLNTQDLTLPGYGVSFTQHTNSFHDLLMVNVRGNMHVLAGYFIERDDPKYVQRREDVYGGVGDTLLNSVKHKILIIGALGHEDEHFVVPGFEDNGPIAYVNLSHAWTVSPSLGLQDSGYIIESLEETDDYRVNLSVAANVTVINHLYLSPSFEYRYDNRTTPLALKTDTSFLLSFRVIY